jgi:hypothetical protein
MQRHPGKSNNAGVKAHRAKGIATRNPSSRKSAAATRRPPPRKAGGVKRRSTAAH